MSFRSASDLHEVLSRQVLDLFQDRSDCGVVGEERDNLVSGEKLRYAIEVTPDTRLRRQCDIRRETESLGMDRI